MENQPRRWSQRDVDTFLQGAVTFAPRGVVTARRLDRSLSWVADTGDLLRGRPGDWLVVDGDSIRTIDGEVFSVTYTRTPVGAYRKTAYVKARRLDEDVVVNTLEGVAQGRVGDWLVQNVTGESWPVPAAAFARLYEPSKKSGEFPEP